MTIGEYQSRKAYIFRNAGFDSPDLEINWILEEVISLRTGTLPLYRDRVLSSDEQVKADDFVSRRLAHEPYQYIFGHAEFRYLSLKVRPGCLIPRPETEYLLDLAIPLIPQNAHVCEIGAGSGAISLALGSERKDLTVSGSELSPDALAIASENRNILKLSNVTFYQGDLFSPFPDTVFDVIISNPPYIPLREREKLPSNVRGHEPDLALFSGADGLDLIRRLLAETPDHLANHGWLFCEIGEDQGKNCLELCASDGRYEFSEIRKDQYGVDRFLFARCMAL